MEQPAEVGERFAQEIIDRFHKVRRTNKRLLVCFIILATIFFEATLLAVFMNQYEFVCLRLLLALFLTGMAHQAYSRVL